MKSRRFFLKRSFLLTVLFIISILIFVNNTSFAFNIRCGPLNVFIPHPDHHNIVEDALQRLGMFSGHAKEMLKCGSERPDNFVDWPQFSGSSYYHFLNCCWEATLDILKHHREMAALSAAQYDELNDEYYLDQAYFHLGIVFHMIADFYAHTDWVIDHEWGETANLENGPLYDVYMGMSNAKEPKCCNYPEGFDIPSKDTPEDSGPELHEEAYFDAVLATVDQWHLFEKEICRKYPDRANEIIRKLGVDNGFRVIFPPVKRLKYGDVIPIEWESLGICPNTQIKLSLLRDGNLLGDIADVSAGDHSFSWTVGSLKNGQAGPDSLFRNQIRITTSDSQYVKISDVFTMETFRIITPNGGEYLKKGANKTILWEFMSGGRGFLQLYQNGTRLGKIAEVELADGYFEWVVGDYSGGSASSGSGYTIQLDAPDIPGFHDGSDGPFTIADQVLPDVMIEALWLEPAQPQAGQNVDVYATIKNSGYGATPAGAGIGVGIYVDNAKQGTFYVKDASGQNIALNPGEAYTGKIINAWYAVPGSHSFKAVADDENLFQESDENNNMMERVYTIESNNPSLAVISPNGGETWRTGTTQNITWTSTGNIQNVKLEYSIDNGASFITIADSYANSGNKTYSWTIPDLYSKQCRIRISDAANASIQDISDSAFTITNIPPITFTITASAGQGGTITPSGNVQVNQGADQTFIISPDNGYSVQDVLVDNVIIGPNNRYIFIDVQANHTIAATFKSNPVVTIYKPVRGDILVRGTASSIAWTNNGPAKSIKLFLFRNELFIGDIFSLFMQPGNGSISWNVGDIIGGQAPAGTGYTIRMGDDQGQVIAECGAFTITAPNLPVTIFSPAEEDSLNLSSWHTIRWNNNGFNGATRLYLYRNGIWIGDIHNNVWCGDYDRTYNWVVGQYLGGTAPAGTGYSIRMGNREKTDLLGESGVFTIVQPPQYTITATAGAGGSISPSGSVAVTQGASQAFTITPNSGYTIQDVKVDGVSQGAISSYTFTDVQANHTISAVFQAVPATYTVTVDILTGHGWILPDWVCCYRVYTVNGGSSFSVTMVPESGYYGWFYDMSGPGGGRFNFPWDGKITIPAVNENRYITVFFTN